MSADEPSQTPISSRISNVTSDGNKIVIEENVVQGDDGKKIARNLSKEVAYISIQAGLLQMQSWYKKTRTSILEILGSKRNYDWR